VYALFKPELLELAREVHQQHTLFESDGISTEALADMQLERLKEILGYVKAHSPFYRDRLFALSDGAIEALDWNAFRKLPFTTKNDLREAGHNMAAAPLTKAWVYYEPRVRPVHRRLAHATNTIQYSITRHCVTIFKSVGLAVQDLVFSREAIRQWVSASR
jgi:hypothetical protein